MLLHIHQAPLKEDFHIWYNTDDNIGSGNGLLPDGTKPLPEPMLTYHMTYQKWPWFTILCNPPDSRASCTGHCFRSSATLNCYWHRPYSRNTATAFVGQLPLTPTTFVIYLKASNEARFENHGLFLCARVTVSISQSPEKIASVSDFLEVIHHISLASLTWHLNKFSCANS